MKKKFKGFSYEDGRIITVAYFNGYSFGDRLLEGVSFKAEIVNGKMVVTFANPNGNYEQRLNQKKWCKAAKEYAEENDTFSDSPSLDGEDVVLETDPSSEHP